MPALVDFQAALFIPLAQRQPETRFSRFQVAFMLMLRQAVLLRFCSAALPYSCSLAQSGSGTLCCMANTAA